jgi:hypothetical protein
LHCAYAACDRRDEHDDFRQFFGSAVGGPDFMERVGYTFDGNPKRLNIGAALILVAGSGPQVYVRGLRSFPDGYWDGFPLGWEPFPEAFLDHRH